MSAAMERVTTQAGGEGWWFWCPGCDTHHRYTTKLGEGETGSVWAMSGTPERPTFTPSLLYNSSPESRAQGLTLCHLFVTDGQVRYLADCAHELAGKTLPLEPARFGPR